MEGTNILYLLLALIVMCVDIGTLCTLFFVMPAMLFLRSLCISPASVAMPITISARRYLLCCGGKNEGILPDDCCVDISCFSSLIV